MTGSMLLRDAEIDGRRADLRARDGLVAQIAPALDRLPGEDTLDCGGGAVIPGLCDHHLHLHAMAAARASVRCGPPQVRDAAGLTAALRAAVPDGSGWIRGTGYAEPAAGESGGARLDALRAAVPDESGWIRGTGYAEPGAVRLDRIALDQMRADVPVRVQHRSGALWILNSAALAEIGIATVGAVGHPGIERDAAGLPTGRLWRADDWLRDRLAAAGAARFPGLAATGAELKHLGITAVTDATPDLSGAAIAHIADAMSRAVLPPRVHLLGVPLDATMPDVPGLSAGPYKIVLADSGMLTYPELAGQVRAAHRADRAVAVHCVTREALVLLLAVLRDVGSRTGDRIEHAGIVPPEVIQDLAALGVRVVTQPGFLADRGDDFLRDLPPADHADLFRCGTLLAAGVPVALSSDAPYGPVDPWLVMATAAARRTASGQVAGKAERIDFAAALNAYLCPPGDPGGPPRRPRVGSPADLVVLRVPVAELPKVASPVHAVLAAGRLLLLCGACYCAARAAGLPSLCGTP
jgi:predicted amidohydrolase YtcJ